MHRISSALPVAVAALLMLPGLARTDLWGPDETRYAQAAREMMESGDYLHLTVNGRPYEKKPPVLMWAQVAAARVTGELGPFEARLPGALASVGTVLVTLLLGRILLSRRAAFLGALFLAVTPIFAEEARTARMDMILAFLVAVSWLGFALWEQRRGSGWAAFLLFFLPLPLGVLTKWTAPLFVLPPALLYLLLTRQLRRLPVLPLIAGLALTAAPFLIWVDLAEFGRILGGASHPRPFHFHFLRLPAVTLPFFLLVPGAVFLARRRPLAEGERRALLLLGVFVVLNLCVLSISRGKRSNYLDPLVPAVALVAGLFAARAVERPEDGALLGFLRVPAGVLGALVGAAAIVLLARPALAAELDLTPLATRIGAGCGLAAGVALAFAAARRRAPAILGVLVAATALGSAATFFFVYPAMNPAESLRPFLDVYRTRAAPEAPLAYFGGRAGARNPSAELVFHAGPGRRIEKLRSEEEALDWLRESGEHHLILDADELEPVLSAGGFALPPRARVEAECRYEGHEYVLLSTREGGGEPVTLGP